MSEEEQERKKERKRSKKKEVADEERAAEADRPADPEPSERAAEREPSSKKKRKSEPASEEDVKMSPKSDTESGGADFGASVVDEDENVGTWKFDRKYNLCLGCCSLTYRQDEMIVTHQRTRLKATIFPDQGFHICGERDYETYERTIYNKDILGLDRTFATVALDRIQSIPGVGKLPAHVLPVCYIFCGGPNSCCLRASPDELRLHINTPLQFTDLGYLQTAVDAKQFDKMYEKLAQVVMSWKYKHAPPAQQSMS